ncbi:MAG: cysteine dioxygenase family protein [Kiloniellales bacterium]
MSVKQQRDEAIGQMVSAAKTALLQGPTVEALEQAKTALMALCARKDLFPLGDFPLPPEGEIDSNYLIYEEADGGYALYVNSSRPGQTSRPHDHGGTWAIVAAIEGEELHRLYRPPVSDTAMPEEVATLTVRPGTAVSLTPAGIHAIHAVSDKPLLHLHLYGKGFAWQGERREYDLETDTVHRFRLEDLSWVIDAK